MKKRLLSAAMVFVFVLCLVGSPLIAPKVMAYDDPPNIQYAPQYMWYYRYNEDGQLQMRCWNLTEGHWVGDWIDCVVPD